MPTGSSGLALKPIEIRRTKAFRSAIDLRRLALLNRGSPCGKLSLKKTYIALNAAMKSRQALSVSQRCRCRCRRVLAVANTTTSASSARLAQKPKLGSECKIATLNHSITGTPTDPDNARVEHDKALDQVLVKMIQCSAETMARRLYERIIPRWVRNSGPDAVRDTISEKHFSHIRSVRNAPGLAKAPSNVVLENPGPNLSRGSRNMATVEVSAATAANRIAAMRTVAKTLARAKAGLVAAIFEVAISVPENILHYRRGRKSGKQAAEDTAKNTAIAAGTGTAAAIAMKVAALAGLGLSFGPFGAPLAIVGGTLLAGNIIYRIAKAARRDIPLDEYRIYFCKNNLCKNSFASNITRKAREARENPYSGLSITSRIAVLALRLWNSLKAPRRIRHKLKVD